MKILIIKRDKIGDLILTTPLFKLIKTLLPSAELHLLANTYNGWVVENDPYIDRLWLYPRVREGGKGSLLALIEQIGQLIQLRRQHYDWIIVAGSYASVRANSRALHIANKYTRVAAFCEQDATHGISFPLSSPNSGHETERMALLLGPLGIQAKASEIPFPSFQPPLEWLEMAKCYLEENCLVPGNYVVIGIGARRRERQPTPLQVLRWAKVLHDRYGLHTIFIWTPGRRDDRFYPGDDEIANAVLDAHASWIHPYRGSLSMVVGLTWLAKTSLYPDSGLMHVAAASPGGVVGLFTSSPEQWGPKGLHVQVIVANHGVDDLPDESVLIAFAQNIQFHD